MTVASFSYTGAEQTWVVPAGVYSIDIEMHGGAGATSTNYAFSALKGRKLTGTMDVTPGETLRIRVGGNGLTGEFGSGAAGYNGGTAGQPTTGAPGQPYGGGGGGATDIRIGGTALSDRVMVANGGGGAGTGGSATDGSLTLYTEAASSNQAGADPGTDGKGGQGGGWQRFAAAGFFGGGGPSGTSMYHTSRFSTTPVLAAGVNDVGSVTFTYIATFPATAQEFYPASIAWDGTTPSGGSIEGVQLTQPASLQHTATFGTGSGERIMNPGANSTNGTVANVDKTGFALDYFGADPAMGSRTGARRRVSAGDWVLTGSFNSLSVSTQTFKVRFRLYRLSADALTRTLLGTADSASSLASTVATDWTCTLALGEVIFEPGETFMVAVGAVKNANSLVAENINMFVGPPAVGGQPLLLTLPSPGLRTLYEQTGSKAAVGVAPQERLQVGKLLTKMAVGVATIRRAIGVRLEAALAVGVASLIRRISLPRTVSAVGVATITRQVGKPFARVAIGVASRQNQVGKPFTQAGVGVPTFSRLITANQLLQAAATGVATLARALTAARSFTTTGTGVATLAKRMQKVFTAQGVGLGFFDRAVTAARELSAQAVGVASHVKEITKSLSAVAVGVADFTKLAVIVRTFTAPAVGVATTLVEITTDILNRVGVGPAITYVFRRFISDD